MTARHLAALLCAAPLLTACASGERISWGGTMSDSAGVAIVSNPAEGVWTPETTWKLEEVLSIGSVEGDIVYQFGQIAGVDVDADGNVYVADSQAHDVRVFDAQGNHLRTLGGPGSGPGEMSQLVTGVFVVGDRILVPDLGNQRIDLFALDGTSEGSQRLDLAQGGVPIRWDAFSGGRLIVQKRSINLGDSTVAPRGDPLLTVPAEGVPPDTVAVLPVGQSFQISGPRPQVRLFEPEPLWDASPDGRILTAINSAWRLEVWGADGSLERIVMRPSERKPVTDRDKDVIMDALRELARQQGAPPQAIEALPQIYQIGDHFPAFASLALGPEGSLWVQNIRSGDELAGEDETFDVQDLGSNEWGVFDAEGRYLGTVTFPGRYQPIRTMGDLFYGVARDELDVQSLKVYRVVTG